MVTWGTWQVAAATVALIAGLGGAVGACAGDDSGTLTGTGAGVAHPPAKSSGSKGTTGSSSSTGAAMTTSGGDPDAGPVTAGTSGGSDASTAPKMGTEMGAFGDPCTQDTDCGSVTCFKSGTTGYCSRKCVHDTDCPMPPTAGKCSTTGFCTK